MDQLCDRLRELIRFINGKSRFSVYAFEMEFYRHDGMEILETACYGWCPYLRASPAYPPLKRRDQSLRAWRATGLMSPSRLPNSPAAMT